MPIFRIAPAVSHRSEQPQMARAEAAVIRAFFSRGLNCIKTSAYRPPKTTTEGGATLHDEGLAADYDSDQTLSMPVWNAV